MAVRQPSHAGSWYSDDRLELSQQLQQWLDGARKSTESPCRALIGPHAGYSYSGKTAASAYKHLDPSRVRRIFILGPSHHLYLKNCALSGAKTYSTPIGDLTLDTAVIGELKETNRFDTMTLSVDENEHSIEMHLPYIVQVMGSAQFTIVPIMVGSLSPESEALYGQLLAKYLDDPTNFFVISSDFCHWGTRFQYTYHEPSHGPIYKSIEALDKKGMAIIESQDAAAFTAYLKQFSNTICGRHPIGVLLNAINNTRTRFTVAFVDYAQSSQCMSKRDSSVSYASAVVTS